MEFPCAAAGEWVADGDAGNEVGGVVFKMVVAGDVVCFSVVGADAGEEFPVAVPDFDFGTFFVVGGGIQPGDDGGVVEAGGVFSDDEAGVSLCHVVFG